MKNTNFVVVYQKLLKNLQQLILQPGFILGPILIAMFPVFITALETYSYLEDHYPFLVAVLGGSILGIGLEAANLSLVYKSIRLYQAGDKIQCGVIALFALVCMGIISAIASQSEIGSPVIRLAAIAGPFLAGAMYLAEFLTNLKETQLEHQQMMEQEKLSQKRLEQVEQFKRSQLLKDAKAAVRLKKVSGQSDRTVSGQSNTSSTLKSKSDRINEIVRRAENGDILSAESIAELFNVTVRTARRYRTAAEELSGDFSKLSAKNAPARPDSGEARSNAA